MFKDLPEAENKYDSQYSCYCVFNNKTVLISSYNNHPVDEIYQKLSHLKYKGDDIPFPIIRLGNGEKLKDAIKQIRLLFKITSSMQVFDSSLNRKKPMKNTKQKL